MLIIGVGALLLPPTNARAQQRMAPLPPDCTVPGSTAINVAKHATPQPTSLAVLPLNIGVGAGPLVFLSDGLPNGIANRIAVSVPRINVVGRRIQRRRPPSTSAEARALGAELGARYLLDGGVTATKTETRIALTLYDGKTGAQVWQHSFLYDSTGVLPVELTAALAVASHVTGTLTAAERKRLGRMPTARRGAYEWALRGDVATDDPRKAADAYHSALRLDSAFAEGYARLAIADAAMLETGAVSRDNVQVVQKEMRFAAARAVTLDSSSSMAWLAEARSRMLGGRAAAASNDAFEKAAALDPSSPIIEKEYGRALALGGERAHAVTVLQRARSLDPTNAEIVMSLGEMALNEHRDAEACTLLNQAIFDDALLAPAWALRALVRGRHDDLRFAWADAETADRLGNAFLGQSTGALIDLIARDTVRAKERLQSLWEQVQARGAVGVREGRAIAVALLATHQPKRALDVLEAVRASGPWYAATLRDSNFDSVRNEPRFRALASAQAGL
jgi:TolB-like protein/tetratricopeptide (TPR) repeat protein